VIKEAEKVVRRKRNLRAIDESFGLNVGCMETV